ncbi:MAG TPA: hypothetical protein VIY73_02225 [Polyangiaceae bacterium]
MNSALVWTLVILAAVVVAIVAIVASRRRATMHRAALRGSFGPEYDRAVLQYGSPAKAEHELDRRARRVKHFEFHDLSEADRARFAAQWNSIQAQFVDDPRAAAVAANDLVNEVMKARGYPARDVDQRVADLSVNHPAVVQHYRAAYALTGPNQGAGTNTEDLRQAVVHYRALFAELLTAPEGRPRALRHAHA